MDRGSAGRAALSPTLLLLMWGAINVMDALLTFQHLGWGGFELNPLLAALQTELGAGSMLAAKVTAALAIGLFLFRTSRLRPLLFAGAAMSLVVLYNAALVPIVMAAGAR